MTRDLSKILFGDDMTKVNLTQLAKATGFNRRTLANWRDCPENIPLCKVVLIVRQTGRQQALCEWMEKEVST